MRSPSCRRTTAFVVADEFRPQAVLLIAGLSQTLLDVTDMEIEYVIPVYVGDKLTGSGRKLVAVATKKTSVGFGAFMTFESEIHNQKGELVAKVRNGSYAFNPGADS